MKYVFEIRGSADRLVFWPLTPCLSALISHAAAICVRMLFGFGVVVLSGRSSKEDYGYFEALVWRFRYVDHSMWRAFECFKDLSCTEVGFSPAWVHLELGSLRRAVCVIECDQT